MSLTAQSIPALYGGVSQQAAVIRSPTQCEEAINCDFSIARGVSKRPPLEILNQLTSTDLDGAFFAWTRVSNGRWCVIAVPGNGTYSVYDAITGDKLTSTNDSAQSYLTTSGVASEDFFAVTIEDKVLIVNRTIQTVLDAAATAGSIAGTYQTLQDSDFTPVDGSIYAILGDENNAKDGYYVKGSGAPVKLFEWVKPGIQYQIQAATMPHALTITIDGVDPLGLTCDFAVETWDTRKVGDVDSNKAPSFLGHEIHSLVFKSDRLGIISGQNISFSRVKEYNDFWRSTVTDVLDDDRIDEKVNAFESSKIYYAEEVSKSLILFGQGRQFSMDGKPVFSPATLSVHPITSYPAAEHVRPAAAGPTVFFASDVGSYSHLREMFVQEDSITMDAANVSAHVDAYVPSNLRVMETHPNLDQLLMSSPDEPGNVYSYQYHWQGQEKVLSSWGRWEIAGNVKVLAMQAIGPYMYCVYSYAGIAGTYIGRFDLKHGDVHNGFTHKLHVDQLQKVTAVFNDVENRTYFTSVFPLMDSGAAFTPLLIRGAGWATKGTYIERDVNWTWTVTSDNTFYLVGDWTGVGTEEWWIGLPYDMTYTFSEQFYAENNRPQLHTRVQLRTMTVNFTDTGFFQVEVKRRGHDLTTEEIVPALATSYSSRTVGDEYFKLNQPQLVNGTHQFPILSRASDAIVSLTNNSPLPCNFQSAEWKALISKRSPR